MRRVTGDIAGLVAELVPDGRYAPRCGRCEQRGHYRDTRWERRFRHVPLWGIPVTLVYAPRRRLLWSGEGRSQATLKAFFDALGPERTAALEGICCDMWQPYIEVIKVRASQAVLVFDKFHIVSHLMAAVDQVRRDEIREKGPAHKALMHKTRFIWLKNPWTLTETQHRRLGELERFNLKINRAYLLKELFAHFWSYRRAGWAKRYLKRWFWWATHSRLPPMRDFAWMLRRREDDILNYFRVPIAFTRAMMALRSSVEHRSLTWQMPSPRALRERPQPVPTACGPAVRDGALASAGSGAVPGIRDARESPWRAGRSCWRAAQSARQDAAVFRAAQRARCVPGTAAAGR